MTEATSASSSGSTLTKPSELTPMFDHPRSSSRPTCRVVGSGEPFVGKQGHLYRPGISAETAGARALHLQLVELRPGERGKAHKHRSHETAIYVLSGESGTWYGPDLEEHLVVRAGEFLYIPADMPHLPYNRSSTVPCVAVIARTDPNEQESVVLLPELEQQALMNTQSTWPRR
jgi:uncharacterized RmlC-like cupin family protein